MSAPAARAGRRAGQATQSPATATTPTTQIQQHGGSDAFPSTIVNPVAPPLSTSSQHQTGFDSNNPFGIPTTTTTSGATPFSHNQNIINAGQGSNITNQQHHHHHHQQASTTTSSSTGFGGLPDFLLPPVTASATSNLFATTATNRQQQQQQQQQIHQEGREPPPPQDQTHHHHQQHLHAHPTAIAGPAVLFGGSEGNNNINNNMASSTSNPSLDMQLHGTNSVIPGLPSIFLPSGTIGATSISNGQQQQQNTLNRRTLAVAMMDASTETVALLSIDDEISLVAKEMREVDDKISKTTRSCTEIESKMLMVGDELRIKELASQRAADSASVELDRVRTSGVDYMEKKLKELDSANVVESRKIYDDLKDFTGKRRERELQRLAEEKQKLAVEVQGLAEKRDLMEQAHDGVNDTAAARKIRKAKTVPEKIETAAEIAVALASQLKKYIIENVQDVVRIETGQAFVDIRRSTVERRHEERCERQGRLSTFQNEAVKRSEELMQARDEARRKRTSEHQKLLVQARERSTKSTTNATQALLDQVRNSHEEAMRKFDGEFESQHQHLKHMHSSIVRDDTQLDGQKLREMGQRFEAHRKMAKELLEADVGALIQTKERESQMLAESWAGVGGENNADYSNFSSISHAVTAAVTKGSSDIQRRISTLSNNVRSQMTALERQSAARLASLDKKNNNNNSGSVGDEDIESRAVVGELKKSIAYSSDKRMENQKTLELTVGNFVTAVDKCNSITNVQRNEVRAMASQAQTAQTQWDAELRRMMADFSIIAAAASYSSNNNNNENNKIPSTTTTPVGFLLSTVNDAVERLAGQLNNVRTHISDPVSAQKRLLSTAVKEDSERVAAHNNINAKVMKIFQMFEIAEASMDAIRQREDEVRIEEISLETQQRQLAEERRQFSARCATLRRSLEQTEQESNSAQLQEREARRELAESERQLASLAIEQRTMLARASSYYVPTSQNNNEIQQQQQPSSSALSPSRASYSYQAAVKANTFIDPFSGHVDQYAPTSSVHHKNLKTASSYIPSFVKSNDNNNNNTVPLRDSTNAVKEKQQQQFQSINASSVSSGVPEDLNNLSADERLHKMKAKLLSAAAVAAQQKQQQQPASSRLNNNNNNNNKQSSTTGTTSSVVMLNQSNQNNNISESGYAPSSGGNNSSQFYSGQDGEDDEDDEDNSRYHYQQPQKYKNSASSSSNVRKTVGFEDIPGLPRTMQGHGMSSMAAAYSPPASMRIQHGGLATTTTATSSNSAGARSSYSE